jgi:hypothetical protein
MPFDIQSENELAGIAGIGDRKLSNAMRDDMQKTTSRASFQSILPVALILAVSLTLNLWGNRWGAPEYWHPDELTGKAVGMFDSRTLTPQTFFYGGIHYYVLELAAIFPVRAYGKLFDPKPKESDPENRATWADRQQSRTFRLARSVSAVMATAQVFLAFLIGNLLFGRTAGLLSSLFLCLSPYFIAISHFATIDTPANFWFWLSCWFALMSWKKNSDAWFLWASLTAGLAIGAKIDRVPILFPLIYSFLMRGDRVQLRNLLKPIPFLVAGYVLANPALLLSPFQFLDGTSRDLFFNMGRGDSESTSAFLQVFSDMKSGMGWLLFLGGIGGLGVAVRNLLVGKDRKEIGWVLVSVFPYYLLVGTHFSLPWYVPIFFPASVLFAAYGCREIRNLAHPRFRMATNAIPIVIVFFTLLTSISMDLQIAKDSRVLASKWIEEQIPAGASIAVGERGPAISNTRYRLTPLTVYNAYDDWAFVRDWRDRLNRNPSYRFLRQSILDLEIFKATVTGFPARKEPYKAWFDTVVDRVDAMKLKSVSDRKSPVEKAEYLVLIDYLYLARISELMSPNSGYRVIKTIQYSDPFGIQVMFPFVNPKVYIFSGH